MTQVPHPVGGGAVEHVGEKTVAVRGHGDEVDPFSLRHANQLGRRIAHRQLAADRKPLASQRRLERREIRAVGAHLLRLAQLQIVEVPRGKAVGDVHQQQLRAGQPRQLADVRRIVASASEFSMATRMRLYIAA